MKAEAMVISTKRPLFNRSLASLVTLLCWLAWSYLWLPLVTLVAWLMGVHIAWIELAAKNHLRHLNDLLAIVLYAMICAALFLSWAYYNQWRFANRSRRVRSMQEVSLEEQAKMLKSTPQLARAIRERRSSVIAFSDSQNPLSCSSYHADD